MCSYGDRDENMRGTKDNLSSDALYKRLRVMIKIPREVHSRECQHDIYTQCVGPSISIFSTWPYFCFMPTNLSKDFIFFC
jgi:hypothetical protein